MSLINQPIHRKGTLIRRVDNYFETLTGNISQILPMGTSIPSCQFATSSTNSITITEAGKYLVIFNGYAKVSMGGIGTGATFSQFRIDAGSSIIGLTETSTTTFTNTFLNSLYYDYAATALAGQIPTFTSSGGFNIDCNIMARAEVTLNASDVIRFYITRTASNGYTSRFGIAGEFYIEQIS
jgi:hypothetical protein